MRPSDMNVAPYKTNNVFIIVKISQTLTLFAEAHSTQYNKINKLMQQLILSCFNKLTTDFIINAAWKPTVYTIITLHQLAISTLTADSVNISDIENVISLRKILHDE
jgi:hypothetical protein